MAGTGRRCSEGSGKNRNQGGNEHELRPVRAAAPFRRHPPQCLSTALHTLALRSPLLTQRPNVPPCFKHTKCKNTNTKTLKGKKPDKADAATANVPAASGEAGEEAAPAPLLNAADVLKAKMAKKGGKGKPESTNTAVKEAKARAEAAKLAKKKKDKGKFNQAPKF